MTTETANPLDVPRQRRIMRWLLILVALITLGLAAWYFCIKRPNDREAMALAKERATKSFIIPGLNLDMVWVAPGSFLMGTPTPTLSEQFDTLKLKLEGRKRTTIFYGVIYEHFADRERPATWVKITQPFWLGKTAVTQAQWTAIMGTNIHQQLDKAVNVAKKLSAANPGLILAGEGWNYPMYYVSWDEAVAFCQKLTERERTAGRLPTGYAYTLPTEAQREYACRAGTTGAYAGDLDTMAWYDQNSGDTTNEVGTKSPNAWGLYDMHGNVGEWCQDWDADQLPGGVVTDPIGPHSGSYRVVRGGSWLFDAANCRSALRYSKPPTDRSYIVGFRVALSAVR